MSYDYMLAKGDVAGGLEGFAESAATGSIGPAETVMTSIKGLFPSVQWKRSGSSSLDDVTLASWFGMPGTRGSPEFHLMVDLDDQVRMLGMSHCERSEVELVARTLGLVAMDEQSMELFGG